MEPWVHQLEAGDPQAAWDLFIERYRRLIFAAIRHYTTDHDEVMDVFAAACEALRAGDMARLRRYLAQPRHTARFSTWIVSVVRNLTVDWFRHRDGRRRLSAVVAHLSPFQQRIFQLVFVDGYSHVEAYEQLKGQDRSTPAFSAFLQELRATYRTVAARRKGPLMSELGGPLPQQDDAADTADPLVQREHAARLAGALASLPPDERLAIQLFVVEGLPAEQVAKLVGFPNAKAVYNRTYRALNDLRAHLERAGITGVDL